MPDLTEFTRTLFTAVGDRKTRLSTRDILERKTNSKSLSHILEWNKKL